MATLEVQVRWKPGAGLGPTDNHHNNGFRYIIKNRSYITLCYQAAPPHNSFLPTVQRDGLQKFDQEKCDPKSSLYFEISDIR